MKNKKKVFLSSNVAEDTDRLLLLCSCLYRRAYINRLSYCNANHARTKRGGYKLINYMFPISINQTFASLSFLLPINLFSHTELTSVTHWIFFSSIQFEYSTYYQIIYFSHWKKKIPKQRSKFLDNFLNFLFSDWCLVQIISM